VKIAIILFLGLAAAAGVAQTDTVDLTVLRNNSADVKHIPKHLEAILPSGMTGKPDESRQIEFFTQMIPFEFRGADGIVVWFSYRNPPKGKGWHHAEADQPTYGSFFYRRKLYVCSLGSIQSSIPVINELLSSGNRSPLTEGEARSMALLFARCSETLQIYGDTPHISDEAREQLKGLASAPTARTVDGNVQVTFYSWSSFPVSRANKWSFVFRGTKIVSVDREPISNVGFSGETQLQPENTLLHESSHVNPLKPQ
jgi:hypothetical protein